MTANLEGTPLTERKVVRRGLIAGLAGLGAAAIFKLNGANKAEAANNDPIVIGLTTNAGTSETRLNSSQTNFATMAVSNGSEISGGTRIGLLGAAGTGVAAIAIGVHGSTSNSGVTARGVNGSAPGGIGVIGTCNSGFAGVQGVCIAGTGIGTRGVNTANGIGVRGVSNTGGNTDADGNGSGIGVQGKSTGGPGVEGFSVTSLGVRGVSPNFVGVVGISDNSHGLYGFTASAGAVGLVGENLGGGLAGYFNGNVQVTGTLFVNGNKAAVIPMYDGTKAMVYCQESPEPWFEDFGLARLTGGVTQVALEREFATLIAGGEYLVFLTPEGDTRGLFVSRKSASGFEVREVQGGTGSVAFSYRVVTRRKDIEGKRFARVNDEMAKSMQALRAGVGVMDGRQTPNVPSQPSPPVVPPPAAGPAPTLPPATPSGQTDGNRPRSER